MLKPINWDSTKAIKGGESMARVPAGGYVCRIMHVFDMQDKQYLKIELDIAEGEYKGVYSDRYAKFGGNWPCSRISSYKDKALGMFKGFITSVEESNDRYQFNFDEQTLVGKMVGVVFGDEEYLTDQGEMKTICKPQFFRSVSAIRSGDFEIPQLKKVATSNLPTSSSINDPKPQDIPYSDEIPF